MLVSNSINGRASGYILSLRKGFAPLYANHTGVATTLR
jgi:hypothetical protein